MTFQVQTRRHSHGRASATPIAVSPFLVASLALLLVAMTFGGASRQNAIPAAVVELASIFILPWAIFRVSKYSSFRHLAVPLCLFGAIALIPVIQIIPLPPSIWVRLPGHEQVKSIYDTLKLPLPWMPVSLTPAFTLRSALTLVTPLAVFLCWHAQPTENRRMAIVLILSLVVLSLILGAVQLSGGGETRGYLYSSTNLGSLVGFFSNRNHEASLLLCTLPLTASLISSAQKRVMKRRVLALLCIGLTLIVIVGLAAVRSRAGVLLLVPALIGSGLILITTGQFGRPNRTTLIVAGAAGVALILLLSFGLNPLLERFAISTAAGDARFTAAPDIWKAALFHLPLGSGLGSFDSVYRSVERLEMVHPEFLNHAHDDYLEILLETGAAGAVLMLLFVAWWLWRSWAAWAKNGGQERPLARGASIVVGLLLVHSIFDYPLRTLALSSLLAFACALLGRPAASMRVSGR